MDETTDIGARRIPSAIGWLWRGRGRQERRNGRFRSVGFTGLGTAVALLAATMSVLVGSGEPLGVVRFLSGDAWLPSDGGRLHLVDGGSGQVKAEITDAFLDDPSVDIVQRDGIALAVNRDTGEIRVVDGDRGGLGATGQTRSQDFELVVGAGRAFVLRLAEGEVQEIDPRRLRYVGPAVDVASTDLSPGVVDGDGVVATVARDHRALAQIDTDELKTRVEVPGATRGRSYLPSVVGDQLTIVDPDAGALWWFDGSRFEGPVDLGEHKDLRVPRHIEGSRFVAYSVQSGRLVVVGRGDRPRTVAVDGIVDAGSIEVTGATAVIEDEGTGEVVVIDLDEPARPPVREPIATAGNDRIELVGKDRSVFVNDRAGNRGAVIGSDGTVRRVTKFPATDAGGGDGSSDGGSRGQGGGDRTQEPSRERPQPEARRPRDGQPQPPLPDEPPLPDDAVEGDPGVSPPPPLPTTGVPPQSVSVAAAAGTIDIRWSGGSGRVAIWADPVGSGAPVQLRAVDARDGSAMLAAGPGTGLGYGVSYEIYLTGGSRQSARSSAVTPFNVPGAVGGVRVPGAGDGTIDVAWEAAVPNGRPIDRYVITARPASGTPVQQTVAGGVTSTTLGGLQNQQAYDVTVQAENAAGFGPSSAAVSVPPRPPSGPTVRNFSLVAVNGRSITLDVDVTNSPSCGISWSGSFLANVPCQGRSTITVDSYAYTYPLDLEVAGAYSGTTVAVTAGWKLAPNPTASTAFAYPGTQETSPSFSYDPRSALIKCVERGASYTAFSPFGAPPPMDDRWVWIDATTSSGTRSQGWARMGDVDGNYDTNDLYACASVGGGSGRP